MDDHRRECILADDFKARRFFADVSPFRLRTRRDGSRHSGGSAREGRIALSELGRRIGLSQPAMSERVRRLEERGIVIGYSARIDPKALGIATSAIMRLRTTHEHIKPCLELFRSLPEVIDVYRVTGEDCFILRVMVPAPEDLERIVDAVARYGAVATSVVLRSEIPKPIEPARYGS